MRSEIFVVDRIDEWFETPVFEPDPDEIWEERATSRYRPLRLAANVVLSLEARRERDGGPSRSRRNGAAARFHSQLGIPPLRWEGLSRALDRWAEKEIETQVRLERLVLPGRWRG